MAEMAVYRLFLRTEVGNLTDYANFVNRYQLVTRAARGYRAYGRPRMISGLYLAVRACRSEFAWVSVVLLQI